MSVAQSRGPLAALRERLLALRDRLLSDPAVLRRSGDFLATRFVARHEARAMFDLAAGFVTAQTLAACVELALFERLAAGPASVPALAQGTPLPPAAMHKLLVAAEPLLLVENRGGGRWGLGRRGAAVLGNPGFRAMIRHHALFYRELADPVALLARGEGTEMPGFWAYGAADTGAVAPYSALMAASQAFVADDILAAYRFARHRRLLDVGGGDGTFAAAALRRWPTLSATVFDLPPVAALAAARLATEPRARIVAGDVFAGGLPSGADVASLVRVLHDHDDGAAAQILRAVHAALAPGGTVVVAEPMAGVRAAPGIAPYFTFYLTAMGRGRPRTADEIAALLRGAGFLRPRLLSDRNPIVVRLMTARKAVASVNES